MICSLRKHIVLQVNLCTSIDKLLTYLSLVVFSLCCILLLQMQTLSSTNWASVPVVFSLSLRLSALSYTHWASDFVVFSLSQGCQFCTLASDLVVFSLSPRLSTLHSGFRPCCLLSVPKAVNSALWLQTLLSSLCSQGCQLCTLASDLVVFSLFPRLSTLHSGFSPCCLLFVPKAVNSELCMLASDLVVFSLSPRLSTLHPGFRLCCLLSPRLSIMHSGFRPCCLLSVSKAINSALWLQTLLSSLCS